MGVSHGSLVGSMHLSDETWIVTGLWILSLDSIATVIVLLFCVSSTNITQSMKEASRNTPQPTSSSDVGAGGMTGLNWTPQARISPHAEICLAARRRESKGLPHPC